MAVTLTCVLHKTLTLVRLLARSATHDKSRGGNNTLLEQVQGQDEKRLAGEVEFRARPRCSIYARS
eukprot:scaffold75502_cov32-Tisochrysis_lutea.AAC.4